ncbi:MAG: DUF4197 domain-containing protein [Syntrophotaleaceae bacterium]
MNSSEQNSICKWKTFCLPTLLVVALILCGCTETDWQQMNQVFSQINNGNQGGSTLSLSEIDAGLREALRIGTERVVGQLGQKDGFNTDPAIRIPLPDKLAAVQTTFGKFGLEGLFDDLELRLNRAAEAATPKAKALFWEAVREMTMQDVQAIFKGPEDAATRYFERKMSPELATAMRPVVDESLNQVGAVRVYNQTVAQVKAIPYAPEIKTDLTGYVVDKGMAGIFHYLAQEEAAIRKNPAKRTTELLKRVFGATGR